MARNGQNIHHVFPSSRCAELGINPDSKWNKVVVNARHHELYHALFANKTPREIVEYLLHSFFNGMIDPPKKHHESDGQ